MQMLTPKNMYYSKHKSQIRHNFHLSNDVLKHTAVPHTLLTIYIKILSYVCLHVNGHPVEFSLPHHSDFKHTTIL